MTLRPAERDDADAIASVHVAAWRTAFAKLLPTDYLRDMSVGAAAERWQRELHESEYEMFVADADKTIVGFLQVRAATTDSIRALYVDPQSWRRGVGSTLLQYAERWLLDRAITTASLWTAKDSEQARAFYERRGWELTGDTTTQRLEDDASLTEVRLRKNLGELQLVR